ncbi:MAG: hypothetical protein INH41_02275 [Myxococcaceae bacterium]|nr:hypothetical protein [Myxococcaceae bacterium]MCA3011206.1 hypothetical protein [Myxococcaceae bacterium]
MAGVSARATARVDATKRGRDVTALVGVSIEHPKHFESFTQGRRGSSRCSSATAARAPTRPSALALASGAAAG